MTKSFSDLTESVKELALRLLHGQALLAKQHQLWLAGDPKAVKNEVFSDALARWDALERVFRCTGYTGCIWGLDRSCPEDAVAVCDACVKKAEQKTGGSHYE